MLARSTIITVLHVAVQEPSVTNPVAQSHVKIAPSVGAVQALAVQQLGQSRENGEVSPALEYT